MKQQSDSSKIGTQFLDLVEKACVDYIMLLCEGADKQITRQQATNILLKVGARLIGSKEAVDKILFEE